MTIYIIRHAEPDYTHDSLTEKGWREARLLGWRFANIQNAYFYVSPLGRARATASCVLEPLGASAEVMPWLREFNHGYHVSPAFHPAGQAWDLLPSVWADDPIYVDPENWYRAPAYVGTGVEDAWQTVADGLDAVLARHGYVRDGRIYRAERPNKENVFLFCHYGVECVLLSHLMNCSPVIFWQQSVALPSGVTILPTEEREPGRAVFRMSRFGDLSHLAVGGEAPSFYARYRETYDDDAEEKRTQG